MGLASRATDIGIGIGLAGIAMAVSPLGLRIATGRLDFNLRIEVSRLPAHLVRRVRKLWPRAPGVFLPHRVELTISVAGSR